MMWGEDMLCGESQQIEEELFYIFNILAVVYERCAVISGDGGSIHTEKSRVRRGCHKFMQNKTDQK